MESLFLHLGVCNSYYEQNSETIFWTIKLKFARQPKNSCNDPIGTLVIKLPNETTEDGEISDDKEYDESLVASIKNECIEDQCDSSSSSTESADIDEMEYSVKNIPETLTVSTLLKQFIKPKAVGPIISQSDLQMDKMKPFMDAGIDNLIVYMKVPYGIEDRFV